MTKKIDAFELERLIADDSVPDEVIAEYLKPASVRMLPFQPSIAVNEATVEHSDARGFLSLTVATLNARGNRKRLAAYNARIANGWKGLKFLAEGDSWFQYPILLRDVVDNLNTEYAVYSIAAAGDTLENMVRSTGYIEELITLHGFDGFLISAGGNDIAGDPLKSYLRHPPVKGQSADDFVSENFEPFIAQMKERFDGLAKRLTGKFPALHIFCHGYDWPLPLAGGLWLEPALSVRQVPQSVQKAILKLMIDRYYRMLYEVAANFDGRFHVVDCRGAVGESDQWFDELHPMNSGFGRVAGKFRAEINKTYGVKTAQALQHYAKVTWRPHEEPTGPRAQSQTYPVGSVVTIGRHHDREIMLDDARVSRSHAKLTIGTDDISIEDLRSGNGTLLDGKAITQSRWRPGQKIRIGHFQFELEFVSAALDITTMVPLVSQPAASSAIKEPTQPLRRLDVTVAEGSIVQQNAPAWAIGVFQNTNPLAIRGAARAIDDCTDGILSAVLERTTLDARLGQITTLPLTLNRGPARNVFFTGLGAIGTVAPKVLEVCGENLANMLVATKIFELATVPMGANSGLSLKSCVESFLTGVLRGLRQTDVNREFRKLTLCEINTSRHAELTKVVQDFRASGAFAALGFDLGEIASVRTEPDSRQTNQPQTASANSGHIATVLLDVTKTQDSAYEYRLLSAENGPDVQLYRQQIQGDGADLIANALKSVSPPSFDQAFGKILADAYIPAPLQQAIRQTLEDEAAHLIIMHCPSSSVIPWEAMYLESAHPALKYGVTRRYKSADATAKKKLRPKITPGHPLRMLLLQNPTGDLAGAEEEAKTIKALFAEHGSEVTVLVHKDATKEAVLEELGKGDYDVLHHSGHAMFDENHPERSGILLSKNPFVVLSAVDLAELETVPHLIFLNACQSGRVRDTRLETSDLQQTKHRSLAEGFILGGVRNFVGTYWVVGDNSARAFAQSFYKDLLDGAPIGLAMRRGRKMLSDDGPNEWANYLQFGDPGSVLRKSANSGAQPSLPRGLLETVSSTQPDPLAGEVPPPLTAMLEGRRGNSELPISRSQAVKVARWMRSNFNDALLAAVAGTPFAVEHLFGLVCQETAYFWVDLIDKLPAQKIIERCVLDASGDFPGTDRGAFPHNSAAFRARYGDDFTTLLIDEANQTRALRSFKPQTWVYKGYGLFQYDLQFVTTDEKFFRERQWYSFDQCLIKAMSELTKAYQRTGDIRQAIRAYNGSGTKAERYASNVTQFCAWCSDGTIA